MLRNTSGKVLMEEKKEKIENASILPRVYYGLHFYPGVAEYRPADGKKYRVYLNEMTLRKMDSSFAGRPVYVQHVDEVNLANLEREADGYVMRSFYNSADGKHWCQFIVVTDKGHEAVSKGWKLSNAYFLKNEGAGGIWNGIEYDKEITDGEYEHLAIVDNPRYQESMILTPEQFKQYNADKEAELLKVANSKEQEKQTMKFFEKKKIENKIDLENTIVVLPKTKKEKSLLQIVNEADEDNKYANGEQMIKVGEEEMTVNELVEKYESCMKKKNEEEEEGKEENEEEEKEENQDEEEKEENEEEEKKDNKEYELVEKNEEEEKEENEEEEKKENTKKKAKNDNFDKLNNAHKNVVVEEKIYRTSADQVDIGKNRYGSN
jgi:hypothetical protein